MRTKAQVPGKFGGPLPLAAPTVWHVYLPAGTEVPARLRKKGEGTADLLSYKAPISMSQTSVHNIR